MGALRRANFVEKAPLLRVYWMGVNERKNLDCEQSGHVRLGGFAGAVGGEAIVFLFHQNRFDAGDDSVAYMRMGHSPDELFHATASDRFNADINHGRARRKAHQVRLFIVA